MLYLMVIIFVSYTMIMDFFLMVIGMQNSVRLTAPDVLAIMDISQKTMIFGFIPALPLLPTIHQILVF